jgi:hypothetical protein
VSRLYYRFQQSPLAQYADQVLALELLWPFPLIVVGVLQILEPWVVGAVIVLTLLPWATRWLVLGRLTRPAFITTALALLGGSGVVGVWVSYDPNLSWPLFLTLLGSIALFFAIVNTRTSPRRVSGGLVIAAALVACYFVGQYGHFNYPNEVGRLARLGGITGSLLPNLVFFTPHPNAAAGFLEGAWLLSLVLAWQARNGERVAWSLAALIITYGLLISGSRGAWIGLAMGVGIWALLSSGKQKLLLAGLGVGLTAGILLGIYLVTRLAPLNLYMPFLSSLLNTAASRLTLYRNSLYLLGDYPFTGIGLGDAFAMVYSRYQLLILVPFLYYAHNLILSVALGLGLLGLVALAWLLVTFYTFVIRVERADLMTRSLPLFRAAWLGVTATFAHGLTDSPQLTGSGWTMPMLFAVLGLTVAIGGSTLSKVDGKQVEGGLSQPRWIWPLWAIIAVVLLVITGIFWRPLMSAWYANMGAVHQTQAELSPHLNVSAREVAAEQAISDFTRALNLNPAQPVANRRLGLIALDRGNFTAAVAYLEQAYPWEPENQATLKALGYAYLWTGKLDQAVELLRQVDDQYGLMNELDTWSWWWGSQNREDLSTYADEMAQRLSAD